MAQTAKDPPAKKIGPEDIDLVFDERDRHGYANLTAGKVAEILVAEKEDLEDLDTDTARKHLNKMAEGTEYDITKYKLGPRTVVYGRSDDPEKVVNDGGTRWGTVRDAFNVYKWRDDRSLVGGRDPIDLVGGNRYFWFPLLFAVALIPFPLYFIFNDSIFFWMGVGSVTFAAVLFLMWARSLYYGPPRFFERVGEAVERVKSRFSSNK